jgi:putative transposase
MRKAFLYRLYPNNTQSDKLGGLLDTARHLYNAALQERRDAYKMQGVSLNYYDQASELKDLRQELPDVALLNCSATQDMLRRLDKSFKAFFRRVKTGDKAGYPRFRGRDRFNSITFPIYGDGIKIKDNRLYVQNVGLIKIKMHHSLDGEINTVTLKRECDKWYAIFSNTVNIEPLPVSNRQVGIDVGLESFAVTSDGEFIKNPRFMHEAEAILRKAQRKVSKRKKGSNSRRKAVKLLARHHLRVSNQRKDFAHKFSRTIVNNYGFIAVEDLQIKNMVRNHHFARSISDAAWGMALDFIDYKAEWAGRQFTRVIPNGTSQECAFCGTVVPKSLSVRIHTCPVCGHSVPRDYNSSLNILERGRRSWSLTLSNGSCVLPEAVCFS